MKKILFLFIGIILAAGAKPDTIPQGYVSGTWDLAGSPYYINGIITVLDGETLTIEPGVIVEFLDSYTMYIQGQILAQGTETDSILFTASNPDTGFRSIRFINTSAGNDTSRFTYCRFEHGKAYGNSPDNYGGALGILNFDKVVVDHCLFRNNEAKDISIYFSSGGGAIALSMSNAIVRNSTFRNNESLGGGAIFCEKGTPLISNNVFSGNISHYEGGVWGQGYGGGILCYNHGDAHIEGNTFHGNFADVGGGAIALVDTCDAMIDHNLIHHNTAISWGGGIEIQDFSSPRIINNTIVDNNSGTGGGIDVYEGGEPEIRNTIIWGNESVGAGYQVNIMYGNSTPDFFYCDVQYGMDSVNGSSYIGKWMECIDDDPDFEDTVNYYLPVLSLCVDAGDPEPEYNDIQDPNNPSQALWPSMGGLRNDMGAYGGSYQLITDIDRYEDPVSSTSEANGFNVYPIPVRELSVISYQLAVRSDVRIVLFDVFGKEVRVLVDENQGPGKHQLNTNLGSLAPGLYFMKLQTNKGDLTRKIVKE